MLELPVKAEALLDSIPHRPPMVWIDEVTEVTENGGACSVKVTPSAGFCDANGGRPTACVEMLAQAYAFSGIVREKRNNPKFSKIDRAFMVGVSDATFTAGSIPVEEQLTIRVRKTRELKPLIFFDGTVESPSGKVYCSATLKVFAESS